MPASIDRDVDPIPRSRVFILRDSATGQLWVRVWQQQPGVGTFLVENRELASFEESRRSNVPHVLTFADGSTWKVLKNGSCACGSPLKRVNWRNEGPQLKAT